MNVFAPTTIGSNFGLELGIEKRIVRAILSWPIAVLINDASIYWWIFSFLLLFN